MGERRRLNGGQSEYLSIVCWLLRARGTDLSPAKRCVTSLVRDGVRPFRPFLLWVLKEMDDDDDGISRELHGPTK